jgi:hypothetical protein
LLSFLLLSFPLFDVSSTSPNGEFRKLYFFLGVDDLLSSDDGDFLFDAFKYMVSGGFGGQ